MAAWTSKRDTFLVVGPAPIGGEAPPGGTVIRVDVEPSNDESEAVQIVGNITAALSGLHEQLGEATSARKLDAAELDAIREGRFGPEEQLEPQGSFMRAIRAAVPDDGVLVQGMTQMGYYSRNYYPVYTPRTYLVAAHGMLGHAFPVALGAKIGKPNSAVVAVSGDGGFLYNSQELATAVQHEINVITIVFNDNAYGNVLRAQIEEYDGHVVGTRLHNPDFVALARSYGVNGVLARDAEELEIALRDAIAEDAVTVIEVPVGPMERKY
jgi:acetolactate synthase-1/2/3 large subunit